ncbi:phage tail protein [Oceanobacillus sp. Castelsardo]|uniref:phage tail protein n=1 Tax=Oceanobacillus sp. Castelsardo TaxID=1851204 RepID=UPI0008393FE2|nr:phage tail protein [Oceanobacillus sp. Castelsardo]
MYNTGQPAVFLKDLTGREYPAIAEVKRNKRVNGQREISLSFLYTEVNKDFMNQLEFGWKVLFDGEWYTITHTGKATDGKYMLIDVTAILSFFVDLNGYYLQDTVENKSFTAANYFRGLFEGTPYTYVLVDNLASNTLSYQDNQSKTERFLYGIDRFKGEYKVQGKVAYIYGQVGSDKDVILHEDLNVNSVSIDVDASGFHTWAKGYGDLPEGEEDGDYRLEVEYISPLAEKYGLIEGPAIKDGRYKDKNELREAVKNQVENSYTISSTIEAIDLTNNGYPEMVLEEGDRVWASVSRLNLDQRVRVMEIEEYFDWEGNIIDVNYTVGNEGIASQYKTEQYNTIADFRDIQSGRKKLEYNWLPDAVRRASEIINGNDDSLFKYGAGEIIGINQRNPNGYMRFNTDGLGFSRDGGKTYRSAITYEGIVADAITTGTLRSILIEAVEIYGSKLFSSDGNTLLEIIGGNVKLTRNNGNYVHVNPDGLFGYNSSGSQRFRADNLLVTSAALGTSNSNVYLAPDSNNEVRVVDVSSIPSDGVAENYSYRPIRAQGLRFGPGANGYIGTEGEVRITSSGFVREDGSIIYRPLRAGAIHSNNFVTTSRSLWMGTDSAMHIVNKGYAEDSSGSPIYRDIYANDIYNRAMITRTTNAYVGTDDELRVVNKGLSGVYRNVRANGYFGQFLSADVGLNAYIGTDLELLVTSRGMGNNSPIVYRPVRASEYNNGSSITYKTNISDLQVNALDVINNLEIKQFILQSDVDQGRYNNWQVGVISELSPEVATTDMKAVNLYKMLSYAVKALQEEYKARTGLEQRVEDLELMMEVLANGEGTETAAA